MASACRGDTSTSLRTYVSFRSRLGRRVFSRLSFASSGRSGCSELRPRFFRTANCAPGLKVPDRTVRPRNPTLISMAGTALGGRLGGSSIARTEASAGFFSGGDCSCVHGAASSAFSFVSGEDAGGGEGTDRSAPGSNSSAAVRDSAWTTSSQVDPSTLRVSVPPWPSSTRSSPTTLLCMRLKRICRTA